MRFKKRGFGMLGLLALSLGCSQLPSPPELPSISARSAGSKALALFDDDKDGKLIREEIQGSPALIAAWDLLDADKNDSITAQEIADRVRIWQNSSAILVLAAPRFYFEGKPLVGATVTLEPARMLATAYSTVTAITDDRGIAHFSGDDPKYPGVHSGLYTIRVSKIIEGKEIVPDRYNVHSELGGEFSKENWEGCLGWYGLEIDPEPESKESDSPSDGPAAK